MFHLSLSKIPVLHPYPLRNLHLHPLHISALDYHEQEALIFAQEYEQLERLQDVCDSHYITSYILCLEITSSAISLVKFLAVRFFRKHWPNYARIWFNQPAQKTRSLAVRKKMPVKTLSRTSDGSFKLSWSRQKNLPPEARKSWTEIAPLSEATISRVGLQSLDT